MGPHLHEAPKKTMTGKGEWEEEKKEERFERLVFRKKKGERRAKEGSSRPKGSGQGGVRRR